MLSCSILRFYWCPLPWQTRSASRITRLGLLLESHCVRPGVRCVLYLLQNHELSNHDVTRLWLAHTSAGDRSLPFATLQWMIKHGWHTLSDDARVERSRAISERAVSERGRRVKPSEACLSCSRLRCHSRGKDKWNTITFGFNDVGQQFISK